ncbi:MAG: hypothetical protein ACE5E2_02350 [Candidatus Binatia bacterium]
MERKIKKIVGLIIIFLFGVGISVTKGDDRRHYHNREIGVSFSYPKTLTIDDNSSKEKPLSVVFRYGTLPFTVSILFKELPGTNHLEEFITQERKAQNAGGYRDQIKEKRYQIEGGIPAIEFIRTSEIGTIYYFVFPAQKLRKLFALWHTTSKVADPQENAVKGYKIMIHSVKVTP